MSETAVRITQLDGKLPNLALMKLAHWHRAQGHRVVFKRTAWRAAGESQYEAVYGSAIFAYSAPAVERFRSAWPGALVGGTGSGTTYAVEDVIGVAEYEHYDYTDWPDFSASIGFTQRGCRLRCSFCVVPAKEGKNRSVNTIADIWRGPGHPKKLHLLDNDFFGQPDEQWRARIAEIRDGGFKVCLNQGINVRLLSREGAEALASVEYRDDSFRERRIYTAWDNLRDEEIFFRGIDTLEAAGIPPKHVMAYMLVGFAPDETMERVEYRFHKMVERGVLPYPMVYDTRQHGADGAAKYRRNKQFQRWALTGLYRAVPSFADYVPGLKRPRVPRPALTPADDLFAASPAGGVPGCTGGRT
ncbi:MAG TPA: radical SAM protein [Longimicrobium sp.]|nr:radical SAM protein [Longimicrobium sp.]